MGTVSFAGAAHTADTNSWSQIGSPNEKCALDGYAYEATYASSREACQKEAEIVGAPFYSYIPQRVNLELQAQPAPPDGQESVIAYTPLSYPPYICRPTQIIETGSGEVDFTISYEQDFEVGSDWVQPAQYMRVRREKGFQPTSWAEVATGPTGLDGGVECYREENRFANSLEQLSFEPEAFSNCVISQSCKLADTHNCPTPELCEKYGPAVVAYSNGWKRYGKRYCSEDEFVVSHACRKCPPGARSTGGHDSLGPDTNCLCTNKPSFSMQKQSRVCATALWEVENKCNKDPFWVKNRFCQQSCYDAGFGYREFNKYGHGDVCKVETEEDRCEARKEAALAELESAVDILMAKTYTFKQVTALEYPTLTCVAPTGLAAGVTTTCTDGGILDVTTCDFDCAGGYTLSGTTSSTCTATTSYSEPSIECTAIICAGDEYVSTNECVACAIDNFNAAGDGASGSDTTCKPKSCGADQYVSSNTCRDCAPGTTNGSGNDATGSNTECTVTYCGANERVKNKVCTACVAGKKNAAGDDASGWNTACDDVLGCTLNGDGCSNDARATCSAGDSINLRTCTCASGYSGTSYLTDDSTFDGCILEYVIPSGDALKDEVKSWINDQADSETRTGPMADWNVEKVTTMYQMFYEHKAFNEDIASWDVGKVTNMYYMFSKAAAFNGAISSWDVGEVKDMYGVFYRATAFNGAIASWDVGEVTTMSEMFGDAAAFNEDIASWDVGNVRAMKYMFSGAAAFNGDIASWDVGKATSMKNMFKDADAFNDCSKKTLADGWATNSEFMTRYGTSWDTLRCK